MAKHILLKPNEAAEIAGVKPAVLKLWLGTGEFKTDTTFETMLIAGNVTEYRFTPEDVERLIKFATSKGEVPKIEQDFVDDGKQENFTVAQIASLWRLSTDTIQRLFENEPGVVALGNRNPRGKRKRITLRIPRAAMERVWKLRSNE